MDEELADIAKKISLRFDDILSSPEVDFITTTRCNLNCKYCYSYYDGKPQDMKSDLAIAFLEKYLAYQKAHNIKHKVFYFLFLGGEPTLDPTVIIDVSQYCKRNSIRCLPVVLTNGIISNETLELLVKEKVFFHISYDGNNVLRAGSEEGAKALDRKIINTLEVIANNNLPLIIRATISSANIKYMEDIVRFGSKYNPVSISFCTVDLVGKATKNKNIVVRADHEEYVSNLKKAYYLGKELGLNVSIIEIVRYKNKGIYREFPRIILLPDGSLSTTTRYTSVNAPGAERSLIGKFAMDKGISLDSLRIGYLIRNVYDNEKLHCQKCRCHNYCRGRNQNIISFGESVVTKPDEYFCEITRKIFDWVEEENIRK